MAGLNTAKLPIQNRIIVETIVDFEKLRQTNWWNIQGKNENNRKRDDSQDKKKIKVNIEKVKIIKYSSKTR